MRLNPAVERKSGGFIAIEEKIFGLNLSLKIRPEPESGAGEEAEAGPRHGINEAVVGWQPTALFMTQFLASVASERGLSRPIGIHLVLLRQTRR
jgi:hypothetical protein